MGFQTEAFGGAALAPRTREVPVPELAAWFDEGAPAVWRVRGLTANEVARANEAASRYKREEALAAALVAGRHGDLVRELQAALGRSDEVEPDVARRLEMLTAGSVEPAIGLPVAVRLAEHYPTVFYSLSNAILQLTGQGSDVEKKPARSTATPASEPPAP